MTIALALLATIAAFAGAILLYLAAPNQRVTPRTTARKDLLLAGLIAEIVALVAFLVVAGPATAVFIWLTLAMLAWSTLPMLTVWRDAKKKAER